MNNRRFYDPEQMLVFLLIIYFCLSEHAHTPTHTHIQLHAENLVYDVGSYTVGRSSLGTGVPRQLSPS